ncbi:hypothetical protein CIB48_g3091 [Xylaria polymorpha]|nr:hypothetical protein CIB48_g3091 [Xylaria polymorpha]
MSNPNAGSHTTARRRSRQHHADWAEFVRSQNLLNRPPSPSSSTASSDFPESVIAEVQDVLSNHDPYNYDRWPEYQGLRNIGTIPWNQSKYSRPLTTTTSTSTTTTTNPVALQIDSDESYDMNLEQRSELLPIDEEQRSTYSQRSAQSQHNTPSTHPTIPRLHLSPPNEQHLQPAVGLPLLSSSQRSLQLEPPSHSRTRARTRARHRKQIPTISYPTRATMHRITRQTSQKKGQMSKKLLFWELDNSGAARQYLYRCCKGHT